MYPNQPEPTSCSSSAENDICLVLINRGTCFLSLGMNFDVVDDVGAISKNQLLFWRTWNHLISEPLKI